MYYVYLIKSKNTGELYYGFTSDLRRRMMEHNRGDSFSKKSAIPWEIIYYEAYLAEEDARNREKQLKRYAQGLGHLKNRLHYSLRKRK